MKLEKHLLLSLSLGLGVACTVNETDDDDGGSADTDNGSDDASDSQSSDSDPDDDDSDPPPDDDGDPPPDDDGDPPPDDDGDPPPDDDGDPLPDTDGDPPPGADAPVEGAWQYSENGVPSNSCTWFEPTNGWGAFLVSSASASGFTITPGDGTDPFDCDLDGGLIDCAERLVESIGQPGLGATANVYIEVTGVLGSSTSMTGVQHGRIDCEGADCAQAEVLLGASFPCEFEIDFDGDAD